MPSWDEEIVTAVVKAVRRDLENEAVSPDWWDKLHERGITRGDLNATVSKQSFIGFYIDKSGQQRFGFYHRRLNVFVAWRPLLPSQIKTAFKPRKREKYLEEELNFYEPVWEPG